MNRRDLVSMIVASSLAPAAARAGQGPWQASFLDGGFDGKDLWSGLAITLAPGWKTYWRVPGAGGIPPEVQVTGDNVKAFELLYPVPARMKGEEGETLGYTGEVVFPLRIMPLDPNKPVQAAFSAFFGVCDVVCIPASIKQDMALAASSAPGKDMMMLASWQARVPRVVEQGPVAHMEIASGPGGIELMLTLASPVSQLFVDGGSSHYFDLTTMEDESARLRVAGAKTADELKSLPVRIVTVSNGRGLEQQLTLP